MIGPGEVIVAITAIVACCWMIVKVSQAGFGWLRQEDKAEGGEPSLTTSELRGLIEQAVEEAIRPLHAKLDRLEKQISQDDRLEPPEDIHRYGLLAESQEEETNVSAEERRQRQQGTRTRS